MRAPLGNSRRIAVVGTGIAGLGCAHRLLTAASQPPRVVVYEAQARLGGHTHTVDVSLQGERFGVDTGFLVFNHRTYPKLLALFATLQVPTVASEMSFGVSLPLRPRGVPASAPPQAGWRRLEWAGTDLNSVFAQRRNLLWPPFLDMLRDLLRFNTQATRLARGDDPAGLGALSLGEFLDAQHYGVPFRDWYLLPMAAAIWSCPIATMRAYPVATFARFCDNHGLLQVTNRPKWYTVRGGARTYVDKIAALLPDLRRDDAVESVTRLPSGRVRVVSRLGQDEFDDVVLASHSDESLAMLHDADDAERAVMQAVRWQRNRAVLHTDGALMPRLRSVWSAWNYLSDGTADAASLPAAGSGAHQGTQATAGSAAARVSVTYWLNRLQPLPVRAPVLVSLNPFLAPRPHLVVGEYDYAHPVFDAAAVAAQRALPAVQGKRHVWLAGAWTGFGFHEDGLASGWAVADALLSQGAIGNHLADPVQEGRASQHTAQPGAADVSAAAAVSSVRAA